MEKWRIQRMNLYRTLFGCLLCLLAVPLLAQPQIGGGNCSTATLSGNYSATLNGRAFTAADSLTSTTEGVGSVAFDGQNKVTFTLTTNTNKTFGTAVTLAGTYSLQANCTGTVTITSGDMASYSLYSYNQGRDYLMAGQNGTSAFTINGVVLPATCPSSLTAGSYPVNGTGFGLASNVLSSAIDVIGVLQFSGMNTIAMNVSVINNTSSKSVSATGTYNLTSNCSATATLTDSSGTSYALTLEFTAANGNNFSLASASTTGLFTAAGRVL
jgi:hypothetical protein